MSEFLNDYFQNRFFNIGVKEVLDKDLIDPLLAPLTPFANPFAERKKRTFPVPSDFRRVVEPTVEMDTTPIDIGETVVMIFTVRDMIQLQVKEEKNLV